jgi:transcriptional antiterminator NusG
MAKKEKQEKQSKTKKVKSDAKIVGKKSKKKKGNPNCKWYVISTRTGHEKSVSRALRQRVEASGLDEQVEEVLVPVQKKIVVKDGEQEIEEEKIYPGYVLIKMDLNQDTWSILKSTDGVRGFVKTDRHPRPLPQKEVDAIMNFMESEQPAYKASFSVGEAVKITEGEFADFIGSVKEIDQDKGKVKVMITFFGREVPIELEFSQVTKL